MNCPYCSREIVDSIPEKAGYGGCGGLQCGHQRVYGLYNEDCRQVIIRKDGNIPVDLVEV